MYNIFILDIGTIINYNIWTLTYCGYEYTYFLDYQNEIVGRFL